MVDAFAKLGIDARMLAGRSSATGRLQGSRASPRFGPLSASRQSSWGPRCMCRLQPTRTGAAAYAAGHRRASRIGELTRQELSEVVQDAWLSRASQRRARAWLDAHAMT